MLSNEWIIPDFYPMDFIPVGVRLTAYYGGAEDLPQPVLQKFLDDVAAGRIQVPVHAVYPLDQVVEAHRAMEENLATGKLVLVP